MRKLTSAMRLSNSSLGQSKIISVLLFLALTTPAQATVWFVKKTGSDSNTCSQAKSESTPKRTIQAALNCIGSADGAGAGHTVRVFAGTYAEAFRGSGDIPGGTSWSSPFTLEANPGDTVTLRPTSGSHIVYLSQASHRYIVLDGLTFDGSGGVGGNAVKITENAHHIRVQNGEVKNMKGSGIQISPAGKSGAHHNEIINMKVHHNGRDTLQHGIYVVGRDNLIERSEFYSNTGFGVHVFAGNRTAHNNIVRRNLIYDNPNKWGIILSSGDGNAAYNNILPGGNKGGILVKFKSPSSSKVYNNTVYSNDGNCVLVGSDSSKAAVKNNLCWQNSGGIADNGTDTTLEANLAGSDPLFVDASNDDFHLREGSPAIDQGTTISDVSDDFDGTSRPQGSAYDIGAYEYQDSQSSQPPPAQPSDLSVAP